MREHLFTLTKLFSLKVENGGHCSLPRVEFIPTELIILRCWLILDNLKFYSYIRWDNELYKTEVGFYINNTFQVKNLNTGAFLSVLDKNLHTGIWSNTDYRFQPDADPLVVQLRITALKIEFYIDLDPKVVPYTPLLLQNFLNLNVRVVEEDPKQGLPCDLEPYLLYVF